MLYQQIFKGLAMNEAPSAFSWKPSENGFGEHRRDSGGHLRFFGWQLRALVYGNGISL